MSRLIDADALKEFIGNIRAEFDFFTDEERPHYEIHSKAIEALNLYLEDAPTIEIVRCKDCKYWQPHTQCGYDDENGVYNDYCGLLTPEDDFYAISMNADDFCSCGKRREP